MKVHSNGEDLMTSIKVIQLELRKVQHLNHATQLCLVGIIPNNHCVIWNIRLLSTCSLRQTTLVLISQILKTQQTPTGPTEFLKYFPGTRKGVSRYCGALRCPFGPFKSSSKT